MAQPDLDAAIWASLDSMDKPPPDVILPPKDIRVTVEKTAGYVKRNGIAFEARIKNEASKKPQFTFIFPDDAYHPYYQWRLHEINEGRGTDLSSGRVGEDFKQKPKGPEPPRDFLFSARMPTINAVDLEVVKITALFVAKNGRSWMTQLSQREAGNFQFDFLRPQHSLNQYFLRLIDQYQLLLNASTVEGRKAEEARIAELQKNVIDKYHVLDRAKKRAQWVKHQESQRAKKEEEEEAEKREYALIDWDEFGIVDELYFTPGEEAAEFPAPMTLNDLQSTSLEQRGRISRLLIEEAMPTDDMSAYYNATRPLPVQYPTPVPQHMPYEPTPPAQPDFPPHGPPQMPPMPMAVDDAPRVGSPAVPAPKRIVQGAVPRAAARRNKVAMAQCPNCKQQIPYDELEQHMKGESLLTYAVSGHANMKPSRTPRSPLARTESERSSARRYNEHLHARRRKQP